MKRRSVSLIDPVIDQNPITVQMLGVCSALAVTTSLANALTLSIALTSVLLASNLIISLLRHHIPTPVRLLVQITIIASFVICIDLLLKAYFFELSQRLSVFVPLIVTNCLVLGRAEAFAMHHGVRASLFDALVNGLGYSVVLLLVGAVRECLGSGTLLGHPVLQTVEQGGWFVPLDALLLAPSAFFLLGLLVWISRSFRPVQGRARGQLKAAHPMARRTQVRQTGTGG